MMKSTSASGEPLASVAAAQNANRPARTIARRWFGCALHRCVLCTLGIGGVGRSQWRESVIRDETTGVVSGVDPVAQSGGHRDG